MARQTHVLVGAGLTSARAAQALRESGSDGDIVVVGEEPHRPYERPDLSKGFLAGDKARESLDALDPGWYDSNDVQLLLGVRALKLDTGSKMLRLADGTGVGYDHLLLATGSAVSKLGVEGNHLEGIHYLRSVDDSEQLQGVLAAGGPLVVIGGGWIGLEVAAVARQKGVDVTVVEAQDTVLNRALGPEVGGWFADLHRSHGVDVRTGTGVTELRGRERVEEVVLTRGKSIRAAAVLVGIGVGPRSELAFGAGLEVSDGVVTDGRLRTSDPYVWAAGDVANVYNAWAGRHLRVEHWANANDQGAFVGRSMLGAGDLWNRPPFFYSDQYDVGMEYRGWADPERAQVVVRGRPDSGAFCAFWLVDGHVHAGMHVNCWDDGGAVAALVEQKASVDQRRLADEGTDLWSLAEAPSRPA